MTRTCEKWSTVKRNRDTIKIANLDYKVLKPYSKSILVLTAILT